MDKIYLITEKKNLIFLMYRAHHPWDEAHKFPDKRTPLEHIQNLDMVLGDVF